MRMLGRRTMIAVISSLAIGASAPSQSRADDHLPIIDVVPTSGFSVTPDGIDPHRGPNTLPAINGALEINGTISIPIARHFSLAYDRDSLGALDSNLSPISIDGHKIYPGGSRDLLQTYHADYRRGAFTFEGGFASRDRRCCADSAPWNKFEWHKGFVGVAYTSPQLFFLNGGVLVFDVKGNSSHHYSSPQALAAMPAGLSLPSGQIYTTQQAITAVVPVDKRNGLVTTGTFVWGALDYPVNGPFPNYADVLSVTTTKRINRSFGLTASLTSVHQRIQGYPFPAPDVVHTVGLKISADYHIDFNRFARASGH